MLSDRILEFREQEKWIKVSLAQGSISDLLEGSLGTVLQMDHNGAKVKAEWPLGVFAIKRENCGLTRWE